MRKNSVIATFLVAILLSVIVFQSCQQSESNIKNLLIGVWKVTEEATINADGQIITPYEHPSLYIYY